MKQDILKKYSQKDLGAINYGDNREYTTEELSDFNKLKYILAEVYDLESHLTADGLSFLKEYYGIENLSQELEKKDGVAGSLLDYESILGWFKTMEKELIKENKVLGD